MLFRLTAALMTMHAPTTISKVMTEPYPLGIANLTLGYYLAGASTVGRHSMHIHENRASSFSSECHPLPGVWNACELAKGVSPLLESIIARLGPDGRHERSARDILLNGLTASLTTSGREATLPLSYGQTDTARKEIASQARRIGDRLVKYSREALQESHGYANIRIRSHCEGHLWTPEVASLLLGPRSHRDLMELYNEWLHRMILLRDALLPFENFEDVPLVIQPQHSNGLRHVEESRKLFLLACLSSGIPQAAIVDFAKVFTAPELARGGYGLQYSQGIILPATLSGSTSLYLLRYHPARLDPSRIDLLFDYEHKEYRTQRTEIAKPDGKLPPGVWPPPALMSLDSQVTRSLIEMDAGSDASRRLLKLQIDINNTSVSVDLGQITRGSRYAYRIPSRPVKATPKAKNRNDDTYTSPIKDSWIDGGMTPVRPPQSPLAKSLLSSGLLHETVRTLTQPGLVSSSIKGETHVFNGTNPVIRLALLGKLYPENVILLEEGDTLEEASKAGKGLGSRYYVLQNNDKAATLGGSK